MTTVWTRLRFIARHNVHTMRNAPLAELSGALGDLGTLLPLMIAMTVKGAIDLPSTLVFSGIANIVTGAVFGIPLPVQPMKAIASVAISQGLTAEGTAAAGLTMGIAVMALSITGLLGWLHRVVPISVVKGIQVGAGLALIVNAGSTMIQPLGWTNPVADNRIWSTAAFALMIVAAVVRKLPYALVVFTVGLAVAATRAGDRPKDGSSALWHPHVFVPSGAAWRVGAVDAAIPQLPLTTLNSVLAVVSLAKTLFPTYPPTPSATSIGISVALGNLVGCWFGAMPICHGSGGLAGQYFFGARSGASIIMLGVVKLVLGLFAGEKIAPLLQRFPKSLLGILVIAAGVELAKVGQTVSADLWDRADHDARFRDADDRHKTVEEEDNERWTVMLITVAGCLAAKNDAVGFLAGLAWHWALQISTWYGKASFRGAIRLPEEDSEEPPSSV